MSDVIVLIVSGLVGIATLIVSKWRCRYVTTYDANGLETHVSACGFTDQVLVPEKAFEQVEVQTRIHPCREEVEKDAATT